MPRLSQLPVLLPRLLAFYRSRLIIEVAGVSLSNAYFTLTADALPLRWHFPVGLLYDIHVLSAFSLESAPSTAKTKAEVFQLTVHFNVAPANSLASQLIPATDLNVHDALINSVKEADFLRSGTAKPIMSLGAAESRQLYASARDTDLSSWSKIYMSLLPVDKPWRNIPFRIFLPYTSSALGESDSAVDPTTIRGHVKIVQGQVPPIVTNTPTPTTSSRVQTQRQTLGTALNTLLPSLFPSRRTPMLAKPLLHGAVVPMGADLQDLATWACYADGWINVVVCVTG